MSLNEAFRGKVNQAIVEARKVLGTARAPALPENVSHTYDDKYLLAEIGTRSTILALRNALDHTSQGAFTANLPLLTTWMRDGKTVTMQTEAEELCAFVKTTTRDVKSTTSQVTESTGFLGGKSKKESFTVTKIKEHEWTFTVNWETFVYPGDDIANKVVLATSSSSMILTTRGETPDTPKPERKKSFTSNEVELSWLLQCLAAPVSQLKQSEVDVPDSNNTVVFTIDRSDAEKCCTPRRNPQIDEALEKFAQFGRWCSRTSQYLIHVLKPQVEDMNKGKAALFDPVPATFVLEEDGGEGGKGSSLSLNDLEQVLGRQHEVFEQVLSDVMSSVTAKEKSMHDIFSVRTILGGHEMNKVCVSHSQLVSTLESMLQEQLISAIGKIIQPQHFAEYMEHHYRQLYDEKYRPKGFCHAVRRPEHYPEGTLSLESRDEKGDYQPVPCLVASRTSTTGSDGGSGAVAAGGSGPAMTFPLNAASDLTFYGDQYLHSFVVHQFSGQSPAPMRLAARARQFSSFILMVGKMSGPTSFDPTSAIIVKNKDDLLIPMLLETIPTPKEFKDAIESLSPEQQRFAKSFRGMQLNSTLFGVVIIQIKPQLERVLNLPFDSLTKEIKLTQELMELFIEYQIPPDLLSFSSTEDQGMMPLEAVKVHVKEIMSILEESKEDEIQQALQERVKHELSTPQSAFGGAVPQMVRESMAMQAYGGGGGGGFGVPASSGDGRARMKKMSKSRGRAPPALGAGAPPPPAPAPAPRMRHAPIPQKNSFAAGESKSSGGQTTTTTTTTMQTVQSKEGSSSSSSASDWTNIPKRMDETFEKLDTDSALRPTILNVGKNWDRTTQKGLLSKPVRVRNFGVSQQKTERTKTFDLLDALTRSGVMPVLTGASLHVILCATHCFEKTLMNTLVQNNVNPIEKAERSSLIMASTIHQVEPSTMIRPERLADVQKWSPSLFATPALNNGGEMKE